MFSVFFRFSMILSRIITGVLERVGKGEEIVEESYKLTLKFDSGWSIEANPSGHYARFVGKSLKFSPRYPIHFENQYPKLVVEREKAPRRVYVSWKEAASEEFFKDVEALFKRLEKEGEGG